METKSYAKAVDDLDSVIRLNPHDAQGYYQRGLAHEQDGDFSKAIADYKTALTRNRNFSDAQKALARAASAERQEKSARSARTPRAGAEGYGQPSRRPPSRSKTVREPKVKRVRRKTRGRKLEVKPARRPRSTTNRRSRRPRRPSHRRRKSRSRTRKTRRTPAPSASAKRVLHQEREKPKRDAKRHKAVAERKAPAGIRYYRAGSPDMRSPDYHYVVRKRDTTFSDIWKDDG